MNPIYDNITGAKPFETAVGTFLMGVAGGSGLCITSGRCAYDFTFSGRQGSMVTGEVKNDEKSAVYGNAYVEFSYRGKPSCISNLLGGAYWAHYLPGHELLCVAKVEKLRALISGSAFPVKPGGDDYKSLGHCIPVSALTGQPFVKTFKFEWER